MIIYEDIFTEDIFTDNETFSDAYPTKLIDDLYYEAEGRLISIHNSIDDALIGGNASAEADGDGGADDAKEKEDTQKMVETCDADERSTAKALVTQVTQPPPPLELDPRNEPVPLSHKEAQAWFYQDPQGEIQGPFLSTEMTEWFRAGYFNMTLMVKRGCDSNMLPLGELIKRWDRVPFLPGPLLPPVLMPGTGVRQTSFSAIDLVSVFKLMKYDLDKKAYQKHIQAYGKKILAKWQETERTEEEISAYKKKLATKVKDILAHFGDYDIYIHESYDDTNDDPMPAVPCEIESNEVPSPPCPSPPTESSATTESTTESIVPIASPPTESSATTESTTESSDSTVSIIPHEPSISPKPTMVPAHADTAPIASTLRPEDEQALFNLFMDDSVPRDALFRVPSNFEEILDESLDRLSSQTENIIILDDADVDNNTGSGPTMSAIDSPDAGPKEIRSEEDLVITGTKPGTTVYGYRPGQSLPQKKIPELKISSKVFAKKSNDIWYRGVIIEITNEHKEPRHREFKIRFDGNGQKSVGSKHLAPIPSNPAELEFIVGSRVIALYEEEQSTPQVQRSWFAGIIAEPPCSRNKNRYLVFFDDGYAQYTDPNKVLNVYYQSPHVWEDIHGDSKCWQCGHWLPASQ